MSWIWWKDHMILQVESDPSTKSNECVLTSWSTMNRRSWFYLIGQTNRCGWANRYFQGLENNKYLNILFHSKIDLKTHPFILSINYMNTTENFSPTRKMSHTCVICSEISPTTILAYHSTEHEIMPNISSLLSYACDHTLITWPSAT